ncbi:MAG: hypothetical protein AAGF88_11645 [Pseudomonadota bacterium]
MIEIRALARTLVWLGTHASSIGIYITDDLTIGMRSGGGNNVDAHQQYRAIGEAMVVAMDQLIEPRDRAAFTEGCQKIFEVVEDTGYTPHALRDSIGGPRFLCTAVDIMIMDINRG